jgi:hypothetical protein
MLTDLKIWKNFKEIIIVLQAIAVISGVAFTSYQVFLVKKQVEIQSKVLSKSNEIASANYVLELSKRLDTPQYYRITKAINYNNRNYPILRESGGRFRIEEVDALLGLYDSIGNLYQQNLISKDMAFNEFSDDFETAWCNKSIQNYIIKIRKEDRINKGSLVYFFAFETLAKEFLAIEKRSCEDLD